MKPICNSVIIDMLYAYYSMGLILAVPAGIIFWLSNWHNKRLHHDRKAVSFWKILQSALTTLLAWPLYPRQAVRMFDTLFHIIICEKNHD